MSNMSDTLIMNNRRDGNNNNSVTAARRLRRLKRQLLLDFVSGGSGGSGSTGSLTPSFLASPPPTQRAVAVESSPEDGPRCIPRNILLSGHGQRDSSPGGRNSSFASLDSLEEQEEEDGRKFRHLASGATPRSSILSHGGEDTDAVSVARKLRRMKRKLLLEHVHSSSSSLLLP